MADATPYEDSTTPSPTVLSQDITLNWKTKATVRLYRPAVIPPKKKLPLIIYLHGGDFVLYSASTVIYHNFCNDIAAAFPAIVISVEYRLAPENRLPAAYFDGLNAVLWAQNQSLGIGGQDPWLEYADFTKTYLLGSSAGANIAYHVALQLLDYDLRPVKIKGLLMNQAFFGGLTRTQSEKNLIEDAYVPLYVNDVLWSLALPTYMNRDHEYCNPISGGSYMGRVKGLPKVYIKGDYGDPLVDRSILLAQYLQSCKVPVYYRFNQGGYHGIELQNTSAAQQLYNDMTWFVNDVYQNLNSQDLSHHHASY
ncbi:hypothetical protein MIMGU_mgv1a023895mg [Erythranthe guttata]|uniref:Alpha/beta hydrolase fold-3 domain-containing protein n=2 Tax=Erythranthe guttata TaxID=4155 RepID=A0A022QI01_ERYGU|nr:hypothetical protein MIMGU_mgv1a023895mg [Erythranthe guttata]